MPIKLLFVHYREVRRFKHIKAETMEEGEKLFEQFVESPDAGDDSAWDEVEDDDPGESELREVCEKGRPELDEPTAGEDAIKELLNSLPVGCVCRTCGARVPVDDLRIHLATHHDGAWAFDTDQVWDSFEVSP